MRITPVFNNDFTPVVLASDNRYAKYLSVAILSIIENANNNHYYDIIVLGNGISPKVERGLVSLAKNHTNVSIRIFDMRKIIAPYKFNIVSYYSEAIFYRVFMPFIMPDYSKAIYLDCDLVVERDIFELFQTDVDTYLVGAVRDVGMQMHYYTDGHQYVPKTYFTDKLQGVDPNNYFNTGVLVLNLARFRQLFSLEEMIQKVNTPKLLYPDQDGFNIMCADSTLIINPAWNVTISKINTRHAHKALIVRFLCRLYLKLSRKKVWIIRDNKINSDNGAAFFKYLNRAK